MLNQEDKGFIIKTVTKVVTKAIVESEARTHAKIEELRDEVGQQGVLLEQLNDKIDIVAENTVGFNRRVTVLEERAGMR